MNIQIFGTKKCNDTKKAERFFKERGIKYQFIDMKEKAVKEAFEANKDFEILETTYQGEWVSVTARKVSHS